MKAPNLFLFEKLSAKNWHRQETIKKIIFVDFALYAVEKSVTALNLIEPNHLIHVNETRNKET